MNTTVLRRTSLAHQAIARAYRPRLSRAERVRWAVGAVLNALHVPVVRLGRFRA